MILSRALPALLLIAATLGRGTHHPLPADAHITDLRLSIDRNSSDAYLCQHFHLGVRQIRQRFRTYRELGPSDEHDHYAWYPCQMEGTVLYRGKSFYVQANMANTMWTDWPDGQPKELGGVHDGELSD